MQYLYAADRDNKRVAERFDPLSAGFLRALKAIADVGARHGKPVTLCGEIGGRPLEAMALIALGYRDLSMSAAAIGRLKAMVLSLEACAASREIQAMLADGGDQASLREPLGRWPNASPCDYSRLLPLFAGEGGAKRRMRPSVLPVLPVTAAASTSPAKSGRGLLKCQ